MLQLFCALQCKSVQTSDKHFIFVVIGRIKIAVLFIVDIKKVGRYFYHRLLSTFDLELIHLIHFNTSLTLKLFIGVTNY